MQCPNCKIALTLTVVEDSIPRARAVQDKTRLGTRQEGTARARDLFSAETQDTIPGLPDRAVKMAKASLWKRAIAIAHRVLDEETDGASQVEAFKCLCSAQGIDYAARGTHGDGRPLYARALDYAIAQRRRRQGVA